jgi:hypothetical protein
VTVEPHIGKFKTDPVTGQKRAVHPHWKCPTCGRTLFWFRGNISYESLREGRGAGKTVELIVPQAPRRSPVPCVAFARCAGATTPEPL